MRYYKTIADNYLVAIGTGTGGAEITEAEYNQLLGFIANRPIPPQGYTYRLRADNLEWELVELPPAPDPIVEDIDDSEALNIILGGANT